MKKEFLIIILILSTLISSAQFIGDDEVESNNIEEPKFSDKLFFGGNLGITFGTSTYINISPIVGYKVNPFFSAGVGVIYEYINYDNYYYGKVNTSIFGGKIFAQSILFEKVILYAENNVLSLERKYFGNNSHTADGRYLLNVPWIGGGIYQDFGNGGGVYLLILFNLNTNTYSPYPPYEFRMGFNF